MQHIVSRGHSRPLAEITFVNDPNPSDTLLVSAAHDKLPQVRNGETGDWIGTFQGHKGAVWSTKIDKRSRTLALTGSGDFSAKLWCATTGKEIHEYKHKHVVKTVDFSNDAVRFVTGCQDGLLRIFDTACPERPPLQLSHANPAASGAGADAITRVHWADAAHNDVVVVGRRSGFVELWDLRCCGGSTGAEDGTDAPTVTAATPTVCRRVSPSNAIIDIEINAAVGGNNGDSSTQVWVAAGKHVSVLSLADLSSQREYTMPDKMNFNEEGGVSVNPNGKTFAAGASDLWLREFDISTGEVLRTFKGHHGPVRSVRHHPRGHMVATGSEDATIRLWSLQ